MAGIPLPALGVKTPENPIDSYTKGVQLASLLQGQQQQRMEMDAQKKALQDQETIKQALRDNNGDIDATVKATAGKINPDTSLKLQQAAVQQKTQALALVKQQGDVAGQQADMMQGAHDAVAKTTPDHKPLVYQQQLQSLQKAGVDVSQMPPQYPGDDAFDQIGLGVKMHSKAVKEALDQQKADAETTAAQARKTAADAAAGKSGPLAPPVIAQANAGLTARWQVLNPNQPPPDWAQLQPGAKKEDFDRADKMLQQVEQAQSTKSNQDLARSNQALTKGNARSDKSYQFSSGQLEKVAKPIDDSIARMSRLQDTLSQNSPQADALVAPELLTVMAGGQGSGLRMNEAEISRIVGGRSKWQDLQAAVNKWSLDPSKANSITPEQRQQIRSLVSAVDSKLKLKQSAIEDARQSLIATDDPGEHKRIVAKARSAMTQVDQGSGQTQDLGPAPAGKAEGATGTLPDGTKVKVVGGRIVKQ